MLMDAYRDERPGICIAYRTDGQLLNRRRIHFQSRVPATSVHGLLIVDNCAFSATTEKGMQRIMNLFAVACDNFGLVIMEKTVVMHQSPPAPNCKWWTTSPTWAAPSTAPPRSTKKWPAGSPKPAEPSSVFKTPSRAVTVSISAPYSKCTNADAAVWSGDLDGVQEAGAKTQSLPPQLSSTDTEAEVAGLDPQHGRTGMDRNPQHLRHDETATTALKRPLRAHGRRAATQTVLL
ncbi:hypothetical protein SprV_0100313400 [Sparganum proliferum]